MPTKINKTQYKLWYHGTTKINAKKILKNGFKKGTYFANHLEDALGYGGNYVFEVALKLDHFYWEYISPRKIEKDKIVRLRAYKRSKKLYENKKLQDKVFEYNLFN